MTLSSSDRMAWSTWKAKKFAIKNEEAYVIAKVRNSDYPLKPVLWILVGFNADSNAESAPAFYLNADPDPPVRSLKPQQKLKFDMKTILKVR